MTDRELAIVEHLACVECSEFDYDPAEKLLYLEEVLQHLAAGSLAAAEACISAQQGEVRE
jgi:hypothetical protein